jgi:hypothetical protein
MRALSLTRQQYANVEIADGIAWRPSGAVALEVND